MVSLYGINYKVVCTDLCTFWGLLVHLPVHFLGFSSALPVHLFLTLQNINFLKKY